MVSSGFRVTVLWCSSTPAMHKSFITQSRPDLHFHETPSVIFMTHMYEIAYIIGRLHHFCFLFVEKRPSVVCSVVCTRFFSIGRTFGLSLFKDILPLPSPSGQRPILAYRRPMRTDRCSAMSVDRKPRRTCFDFASAQCVFGMDSHLCSSRSIQTILRVR